MTVFWYSLAFFAALPAALPASSNASAVSSMPPVSYPPPPPNCDQSTSKFTSTWKTRAIAWASSRRAFTTPMTTGRILLRTGMNRLPTARAVCWNCALRMRSWLAGELSVRAMSPCTLEVACITM